MRNHEWRSPRTCLGGCGTFVEGRARACATCKAASVRARSRRAMKKVKEKDASVPRQPTCQDCGDPVPPSRRVCDSCKAWKNRERTRRAYAKRKLAVPPEDELAKLIASQEADLRRGSKIAQTHRSLDTSIYEGKTQYDYLEGDWF